MHGVSAASLPHVVPHAVPEHAQRSAAPAEDATPAIEGAEETAEGQDPSTRSRGSDTPFTHALFQGQGKKLGIVRRLPSQDDIATLQAEVGVTPSSDTGTEGASSSDDVIILGTGEGPAAVDGSGLNLSGGIDVTDPFTAALEAAARRAEERREAVPEDGVLDTVDEFVELAAQA